MNYTPAAISAPVAVILSHSPIVMHAQKGIMYVAQHKSKYMLRVDFWSMTVSQAGYDQCVREIGYNHRML